MEKCCPPSWNLPTQSICQHAHTSPCVFESVCFVSLCMCGPRVNPFALLGQHMERWRWEILSGPSSTSISYAWQCRQLVFAHVCVLLTSPKQGEGVTPFSVAHRKVKTATEIEIYERAVHICEEDRYRCVRWGRSMPSLCFMVASGKLTEKEEHSDKIRGGRSCQLASSLQVLLLRSSSRLKSCLV